MASAMTWDRITGGDVELLKHDWNWDWQRWWWTFTPFGVQIVVFLSMRLIMTSTTVSKPVDS